MRTRSVLEEMGTRNPQGALPTFEDAVRAWGTAHPKEVAGAIYAIGDFAEERTFAVAQCLARIGHEGHPIEPDPDKRALARTVLVRRVIVDHLLKNERFKQDPYAASECVVFFAEDVRHAPQYPRDREDVHTFLSHVLGMCARPTKKWSPQPTGETLARACMFTSCYHLLTEGFLLSEAACMLYKNLLEHARKEHVPTFEVDTCPLASPHYEPESPWFLNKEPGRGSEKHIAVQQLMRDVIRVQIVAGLVLDTEAWKNHHERARTLLRVCTRLCVMHRGYFLDIVGGYAPIVIPSPKLKG